MKSRTSIAIDGPTGAGKSTLARTLAGRLGFLYVDTGAIYRAVALFLSRRGIDVSDEAAVEAALQGAKITLNHEEGLQQVFLNGENVSALIRSPEISQLASKASALGSVRAFLLQMQRDVAASQDVIMDGRDIGTVVLPDAQVKVFLTASPEARARRRFDELAAKGVKTDYETVLAELTQRDQRDMGRAIAPLRPAPDAHTLDTTEYTLHQSADELERLVRKELAQCFTK